MLGGAEAHSGYPERAPTASLVAGAIDLFTSGPGLTPQFYSSRQSSCHDVSLAMLIPSLIRQACDEVERILLKSDDISVRPNIKVFLSLCRLYFASRWHIAALHRLRRVLMELWHFFARPSLGTSITLSFSLRLVLTWQPKTRYIANLKGRRHASR